MSDMGLRHGGLVLHGICRRASSMRAANWSRDTSSCRSKASRRVPRSIRARLTAMYGQRFAGAVRLRPSRAVSAATRASSPKCRKTSRRGLKRWKFVLGVKNLFDRDPPRSNQLGTFIAGSDPSYYDPRARFVYGKVTYTFE